MREHRRPPEGMITDSQRVLAERVRHRLTQAAAAFGEDLVSNRWEAWYIYHLEARASTKLKVEVRIGGDQFSIAANGADLRVELAGYDVSSWIVGCLNILDALIKSDLRIRVRRGLLGRVTGAIWVPDGVGGAWNGDLQACRGKGQESVFLKPWFELRKAE